jgi:hypothetical protein
MADGDELDWEICLLCGKSYSKETGEILSDKIFPVDVRSNHVCPKCQKRRTTDPWANAD